MRFWLLGWATTLVLADDDVRARAKRDVCLGSEERCFDDVGCVPCKYGRGSYSPEDINMSFRFYSSDALVKILQYADLDDEEELAKITVPLDREIWVIIHGFEGQWPLEWLELMRRKLVSAGNGVIVARWTDGTAYPANYPQAAVNALTVGRMIGRGLKRLAETKGLDLGRVNLIGFSLGVHVAGHAGAATGGRVRQIVGLDPPEKLYEGEDEAYRLDPSDARLVQAIHTHGASLVKGGLGTMLPMGDVDLYINGGKEQPGCAVTSRDKISVAKFYDLIKIVGCNHIRATALFTDSVANRCNYTAYKCESRDLWKRGQCFGCGEDGEDCLRLGYQLNASTPLRGKFWLNTLVDQGVNEPDEAYCGRQYRLTLFPDKAVKGIIQAAIVDGAYESKWQKFQKRTSTLYEGGRSAIVVGNTEAPKRLKLFYNRFNALVVKSAWSFNLTRAVLINDEGEAFEYRGGHMVEDDYETSIELTPTRLNLARFMAETAWTSDARGSSKPWWWPG